MHGGHIMNKFIAIRYRYESAPFVGRIRSRFLDEIPFRAAKLHIYDFPTSKIVLAAAEPAVSGFARMQHTYVDEPSDSFLTFDGVPFLDQQDFSRGWAECLCEHVDRVGPARGAMDLLGAYCLAYLSSDGDLCAFGDFAGLCPVYYYESDGCFAVSNRQRLLQAVVKGGDFEFDLSAYSWLTGQSNLFGSRSPYSGVRLLKPGEEVVVGERGARVTNLPTRHWWKAETVRADFTARDLNEIYEYLIKQMTAFGRLPFESLTIDLSGGLDSRTVLALAVASGAIERVDHVYTSGVDGSPDIEAAKHVARALDVSLQVNTVAPPTIDVDAWWTHVRGHCFRCEGTVCPPDGLGGPERRLMPALSGTGGEIYRPHIKAHKYVETRSVGDAKELFRNYQQKHDPLDLQHPAVTRQQRRELYELVDSYARDGVEPEDMRYVAYVDSRLPWWAGGLHANVMGRLRLNPLVSWPVARVVYGVRAVQRQIDRVHYEILRRASPRLVKIPFAGYAWDERLRPYMDGTSSEAATKSAMVDRPARRVEALSPPQRFMFAAWDGVFDHLLEDRNALLYDIVDAKRVARVRGRREAIVRSVVTLKQIFALLAIKETTEGRVARSLLGPEPERRVLYTNVAGVRGLGEPASTGPSVAARREH